MKSTYIDNNCSTEMHIILLGIDSAKKFFIFADTQVSCTSSFGLKSTDASECAAFFAGDTKVTFPNKQKPTYSWRRVALCNATCIATFRCLGPSSCWRCSFVRDSFARSFVARGDLPPLIDYSTTTLSKTLFYSPNFSPEMENSKKRVYVARDTQT